MLSFKTINKARFSVTTLLVAALIGAASIAIVWKQQPPPPPDPKVAELTQRVKTIETSLAQATMALDIERKTISEMNSTLLSLQAESLEQQLALRFYQKVMAPEYTANGVHIEKVILTQGISDRHVRFEVLIAQLEKRKRYIKGNLALEILGSFDGKPQVLKVSEMVKSAKDLKVSFRFFQHVKSNFDLPEGFMPERLKVTIKMPRQRGQKAANVTQEYPWNELIKLPMQPILPGAS
tara:strand:+ start:447 stop:1157 length:711 start_codon:yes stop_codon:yes gene_type:complete